MLTPRHYHRRQVILFLVTVILPSSVLVALSVRIISQERELADKRLGEEQQRLAGQVSRELLTRLERIKLQEVNALAAQPDKTQLAPHQDSAVVLVCRVENNRMVLPWDSDRAAEEFHQSLDEPLFAQAIEQGEYEELAVREFGKAAKWYGRAVNVARHARQTSFAQLLLARVLTKLGRVSEANVYYGNILSLSSEIVDEQRVALSLYAAARLITAGVEHRSVLERIRAEGDLQRWLAPTETYILRDLANALDETAPDAAIREAAKILQQQILLRVRRTEQALALQDEFLDLLRKQPAGNQRLQTEPLWIPYGEETWLASLTPPLPGLSSLVVVVSARDVLASLDATDAGSNNFVGAIQFAAVGESKGEPLAENFAGLRLAFVGEKNSSPTRGWNLQRYFYFLALLLVLTVTLFGSYLLWRDVRREVRLAQLRSQFVSSVSHELRTPLTAIRMFAETLLMGRATGQQMQAEYMETIVTESERLTRLLNNVLDFSKIEQGKKSYHLEPTSLDNIVRASVRALKYPLAQGGFELRIDVEPGLPDIQADRDALQQAFLNLLTNAMKFSGPSREIDVRLQKQNGRAVIEVTDRGLGMAPEDQLRVFEKFYRAPTPENKLIPGTGLGLTLVEHIAKAHGGHVEVRSAPGRGSKFSIHLPLETEYEPHSSHRG
jgi:signal transduction histidine kinase